MLMINSRGLVPVGSGWGVRDRLEDWIALVIGLRYCVPCKRQTIKFHEVSENAYILLSNQNLDGSSFWYDLSQITQLYGLLAVLIWLDSEILQGFRIESSTSSKLR